jgi:hypothetical protein
MGMATTHAMPAHLDICGLWLLLSNPYTMEAPKSRTDKF